MKTKTTLDVNNVDQSPLQTIEIAGINTDRHYKESINNEMDKLISRGLLTAQLGSIESI